MISVELRSVRVEMRGHRLLDGIDFRASSQEWVAIVGPSGAGKSTLLRTLLGLQGVSSGQCLLEGRPVASISDRQRSEWLGWLPQRLRIDEPIAAIEMVAAWRYRFDEAHHTALQAAQQAMLRVGVGHLANRAVNTLSGGEAQRVAMAAALAQDPRILLLDEPSVHLDPARQIELYSTMSKEWREGRGVICVTHDPNLLQSVVAEGAAKVRVVGMREGRIVFDLAYDSDQLANELSELYGIEWHAIEFGERKLFLAGGRPVK